MPAYARRLRFGIAFLFLILAAGCGRASKDDPTLPDSATTRPSQETPKVAVRVARVTVGRAPRIVRAMGSFEADDIVMIGAKVAGRIAAVGPDVGDKVGKGAMLAKVDELDYVLARDQRARALEESLVKLGLEALPEGDIDFEKLPTVERARLEAVNAKSKYDRALPLHSRTPPLISDQDLADLKVAWDMAESARKGALLGARTDLAQARTRKTELEAAEQRIRDTVHVAPEKSEAWLVGARQVSVGNYVSIGNPLYRLVDADPLRLRVRVPERRMEGVTPGKEVAVRLSDSATPIVSRVSRLRPEVDVRTRTHEVEISVANPDLTLAVGAFAVAEILIGEDSDVPMIDEKAIVVFAGINKVFVPDQGKAGERLVVTGRRIGGRVEITEGLKPGDAYIADPSPTLVPGTPIRIEPDAANGAAK